MHFLYIVFPKALNIDSVGLWVITILLPPLGSLTSTYLDFLAFFIIIFISFYFSHRYINLIYSHLMRFTNVSLIFYIVCLMSCFYLSCFIFVCIFRLFVFYIWYWYALHRIGVNGCLLISLRRYYPHDGG